MKTLLLSILMAFGVQTSQATPPIKVGAERMDLYLKDIQGKQVGLIVNPTSVVGKAHLVDTLLSRGIKVKSIFAPEHGYKGNVERGLDVSNTKDSLTGIQVFSIYGKTRKPLPEQLKDLDILIFDIQDVGARFFTYISTLHYIMEACAEQNIPLMVLDRPNPIGHYVDGPVLEPKFKSFIGMHTIPIAHGMTVGEYAKMINGEGWLTNGVKCTLQVVEMEGYTHSTRYYVPVPPSPNLPDMKSIYLYPSICLFEGTQVNEGRGTKIPFQQFGSPYFTPRTYQYVPKSIPGFSLHPKFEGEICYGYNLSEKKIEELEKVDKIDLKYLIEFYQKSPDKSTFFEDSFDLLAGSDKLRKQIIAGLSEAEIKKSWQPELEKFKNIRNKYLLY